MKIALVSPYDWASFGGVNNHISQMSRQLMQMGHYVRILVPASEPVDDPFIYALGNAVPVPASGSMARISLNPRLGSQVREILLREQFDVVHVHEPLMPMLPIHVLRHSRAANPRAVNVGTFHATKDDGSRLYSYSRGLLKRWFRELDGKIAVSPTAAQYVNRYFHGFYNVIPNGLDIGRFDSPDIEPLPEFDDGMVNILYVGRAEKRKGLSFLIRAFGMVHARNPQTRLIVVGPESRARRRYEASVRRSGQRGIVFVPGVSHEELPRYHRSAQIFCSPALGHESQGYVLLEAMAAGLPVVASNIEGYASVITNQVDGLLVRPKDSTALANALSRLVRDSDRRAQLAAAGRTRVDHYSWPRVSQQVLSYYERLLDQQQTVRESHERGRMNRLLAHRP